MSSCACGSSIAYEKCCGVFIAGHKLPDTPEQLMRSRYTAFTQANVEYIVQTMQGEPLKDFNPENTKQWAQQVDWLGLQVLKASHVDSKSKNGLVEFIASYRQQNKIQNIQEQSEFERIDGRWFYTGGKGMATSKQASATTKVGRNDACLCGSGKKYKKCCG